MNKEDKSLLLKDLCARLKYNVMCEDTYGNSGILFDLVPELNTVTLKISKLGSTWTVDIDCIKPYLRSLSSMTEEEKKELSKKYVWNIWTGQIQIRYHSQGCWDDETECPTEEYIILFDWLNAHHFDYRGLIEKGLALEAPKDMYNFNTKTK